MTYCTRWLWESNQESHPAELLAHHAQEMVVTVTDILTLWLWWRSPLVTTPSRRSPEHQAVVVAWLCPDGAQNAVRTALPQSTLAPCAPAPPVTAGCGSEGDKRGHPHWCSHQGAPPPGSAVFPHCVVRWGTQDSYLAARVGSERAGAGTRTVGGQGPARAAGRHGGRSHPICGERRMAQGHRLLPICPPPRCSDPPGASLGPHSGTRSPRR